MINFPPFRLDTVNQCLWRRDGSELETRVDMGPKAFGVLCFLVERAGRLVTQDELLDALWPRRYVQPEVLKSQILSVRQALGDNPRAPKYIETVQRRGYRFIAPVSRVDRAVAPSMLPVRERLVGRDAPLKQLRSSLRSAVEGARQIVFVTGEAGIGKTMLVEEFRETARGELPALRVAFGQCVEGYGGHEPYYPFLEAIGGLCTSPGGDSVVEVLGSVAPTWLVQFPSLLKGEHRATLQREIAGATRERMLREFADAIDKITERSPLLLVLSDLHWMDHASVDLIAVLARRHSRARVMVVGTYRPADLALSDHPLKRITQELLSHHLIVEIPLQRLKYSDVAQCVRGLETGEAGADESAALIYKRSDGNPLFMTAFLNHLLLRGMAKREGDVWQLLVPVSGLDTSMPDDVRQLLDIRIERLSQEEQRALEAASVLGTSFEIAAGAAAAGMTLDTFEDLCERLSRQQTLLLAAEDGPEGYSYRFAHDLYRDALYRRVSPPRRARTHVRCGEWLESDARSNASDVAPILAYHFEQGASWERAVKYLRIAAELCTRRIAYREATELLRHALKLVGKLPPAQSREAEIGLLGSLCNLERIDNRQSFETYQALIERSAQYGFREEQVWALIGMSGVHFDVNRPIDFLNRAIDVASQIADEGVRVKLLATAHVTRLAAGNASAEQEAEFRSWIARARPVMSAAELAPLLMQYAWMLNYRSHYREAIAAIDEAHAGDQSFVTQRAANASLGYLAKADSLVYLGEWGKALAWIEERAATFVRNGQPLRAAGLRTVRERLCVLAEDLDGAERCLEATQKGMGDANFVPLTRTWLAWSALVTARRGDAMARKILAEIEADMAQRPLSTDWIYRPIAEWAFVEALLMADQLAEADTHFRRFLAAAEAIGEITWQGLAWEAGARVALARQSEGEAEERLARGLAAIEGYEAPNAAWRIHASIAEQQGSLGSVDVAREHRRQSARIVRALADSLPAGNPIRAAFLASARVARILEHP